MSSLTARPLTGLRTRLIVGYVLVLLVLAGTWAWSLFGPLTDTIVSQQEEELLGVANAGGLALESDSAHPDIVAQRVVQDTDLRVTIVAADGTVLADSAEDPASMENHADRPEVRNALAGRSGSDTRLSATQDVEQLYVAVPGSIDGARVAFRVSRPLDRIEAVAAQARGTGLVLLAAACLVALVVAYRIAAATSAPVRRLADTAHRIAAGDLAAPVRHEDGELGTLSDALRELSTQVRARMADLETEKRDLRTVLNGLTDAVFLLDGDTVRLVNDAAPRMFGTPDGGWRGAPLDERAIPASLAEQIATHVAQDEPVIWESGPDPRARYLRVTVLPLSTEPDRRTLVVVADVTERRRLDSVRRDFVSNASHELKTPVAGIQLLAESASAAAADGDEAAAAGFLASLHDEASRLRQVVSDLLDLSRLETTPEDDALSDVRQVIDLSITSHRSAAAHRGLDLSVDYSAVGGQDVFVRAEPTDLAIALDNLLDNAIAYTEHGGVRVSVEAPDDEVCIRVTDTGIGIPEQDLDRVFERFYRVDPARTRATGGTGLGLSLVRHAVQRSCGSVSLESDLGQGTTVTTRFARVF